MGIEEDGSSEYSDEKKEKVVAWGEFWRSLYYYALSFGFDVSLKKSFVSRYLYDFCVLI